ncbi:regulatory LuxR family protein [Antricoccus suffuscus]|uniref:Regulatory LuxR family protein n=1 Tax=Antricoccus suffuscus TaxID=1629062 RepID=A0A2T0ZWM7_9ACTN|nr:LuxR C-terminal-related transcriptional regulator [Antricoccus suffuscus]PRZ40765.1 regulatory LuxR family protein [Antricoccus suffuscus]
MSPVASASSARSQSMSDLHRWALESARYRSANSDAHAAVRELSRHRERATRQQDEVLGGRVALDRLLVDDEPDHRLRVQKVVDLPLLQNKLVQIAQRTRHELLSLHSGDAPSEEAFVSAQRTDRELVDRGVRLRIVYPLEFAQLPRVRDYTETMQNHGAEFQFADAVPYRIIVSDAARAVVPIVRGHRSEGAIITGEPALVSGLRHLARGIFRSGRNLRDIDLGAASGRPTELELEVIRAMSLGLADDAAARRLAVSERTFRRYVAQVFERLGATSRFQAGVRAVERGWL